MVIDQSAIVYASFIGIILDAVGGLYLAYDLLGGRQGPLSLLTRSVTYGVLFGVGYGIPFGFSFGVVAGAGLGTVLALEFGRVARHQSVHGSSPLFHLPVFGVLRGLIIGLAAVKPFGARFGLYFGGLSMIGLYIVYRHRFAPTYDYRAETRPVISRHRIKAPAWRAAAIGLAAILAGTLQGEGFRSVLLGLEIGATVMTVSFVVGILSPLVEWWADNLPERLLGALGVASILLGLFLQSIQYLIVILHLPVR